MYDIINDIIVETLCSISQQTVYYDIVIHVYVLNILGRTF